MRYGMVWKDELRSSIWRVWTQNSIAIGIFIHSPRLSAMIDAWKWNYDKTINSQMQAANLEWPAMVIIIKPSFIVHPLSNSFALFQMYSTVQYSTVYSTRKMHQVHRLLPMNSWPRPYLISNRSKRVVVCLQYRFHQRAGMGETVLGKRKQGWMEWIPLSQKGTKHSSATVHLLSILSTSRVHQHTIKVFNRQTHRLNTLIAATFNNKMASSSLWLSLLPLTAGWHTTVPSFPPRITSAPHLFVGECQDSCGQRTLYSVHIILSSTV